MSNQNEQLPPRSKAEFIESLTDKAVGVTKEFGWDFFKAGALLVDEWQERRGDNDPEVLYLLVREAKVRVRRSDGSKEWVPSDKGKWNIPCGRLQPWETFEAAAIREGTEETGHAFDLGELCHIGHRFDINNPYVIYIYVGRNTVKMTVPDPEEIAEIRWFTYSDILEASRDGMLRNPDLTLGAVEQYRACQGISRDLITTYPSKFDCNEI